MNYLVVLDDLKSLHQQQALAQDFIASKREELIAQFGNKAQSPQIDAFYEKNANQLAAKEAELGGIYKKNSDSLQDSAHRLQLGVNKHESESLKDSVQYEIDSLSQKTKTKGEELKDKQLKKVSDAKEAIDSGHYKATNGVIPFHAVDNTLEYVHLKEKNNDQ